MSTVTMAESRALGLLRDIFGYPAFRGAQAEIIEHVANDGDALVLMPTGGTFYYVNNSVEYDYLDMTRLNQILRQPTKPDTKSYFSWHQRPLELSWHSFFAQKNSCGPHRDTEQGNFCTPNSHPQ